MAGTGSATHWDETVTSPSRSPSCSFGVVVERDGSLYVSTSSYVGRIGPEGTITRIAGASDRTSGFSGDGGPALSARVHNLVALGRDGQGNLYVSDSRNNRVRKITPGGVISTVA